MCAAYFLFLLPATVLFAFFRCLSGPSTHHLSHRSVNQTLLLKLLNHVRQKRHKHQAHGEEEEGNCDARGSFVSNECNVRVDNLEHSSRCQCVRKCCLFIAEAKATQRRGHRVQEETSRREEGAQGCSSRNGKEEKEVNDDQLFCVHKQIILVRAQWLGFIDLRHSGKGLHSAEKHLCVSRRIYVLCVSMCVLFECRLAHRAWCRQTLSMSSYRLAAFRFGATTLAFAHCASQFNYWDRTPPCSKCACCWAIPVS